MLRKIIDLIYKEHEEIKVAVAAINSSADIPALVEVFINHIACEEEVMRESGYSNIEAHVQAHDQLIGILKDLHSTDILKLRSCILELMTNHIAIFDMELLNGLEMEHASRD